MKQVFVDGKGGVHVLDVPVPSNIRNGILVRTWASLISQGTEGAAISTRGGLYGLYEKAVQSGDRVGQVWDMVRKNGLAAAQSAVISKLEDFTPLGYSSAGVVESVADNEGEFAPGDRVACMGVGFASHAEFAVVPSQLVAKVPAVVPMEQAAFGAIACIAMQGIRRLDLSPGESIAVIGLGLIGQLAVQVGTALGYRMLGVDLDPNKATLASECGALDAWSVGDGDSVPRVGRWTEGNGADGVLIAAASKGDEILNSAFDLCRQRGRVSVVGDVGLGAERGRMYRKELDLRMSASYGPGRYDPEYELEGRDYPIGYARWTERRNLSLYIDLLTRGKLHVDRLISRECPIEEAASAYQTIKSGATAYGVLFSYNETKVLTASDSTRAVGFQTSIYRRPIVPRVGKSGPIRIGLIGCGGFTKAVHLPNMNALSNDFVIEGVASRSGATASAVAKRSNARIVTSDYRSLLDDPDIDAVLIATRHSSHGSIAAQALEAGKHIFVEKPLALTIEDCERIERLASERGLVVRVGFNRRFAPLYQRARALLAGAVPRILVYRVNVGDLTQHWSASAEEGGRLLGEGCHFFDLFNWFYSGEPVSCSSYVAGDRGVLNPNAVFTARYPCGSVATLIYTTLGSKLMPKERLEAFGSGVSLSCTDFAALEVFGGTSSKHGHKDKGHRGILSDFSRAIRGEAEMDAGAGARAGLVATAMGLSVYAPTSENSSSRLDQ